MLQEQQLNPLLKVQAITLIIKNHATHRMLQITDKILDFCFIYINSNCGLYNSNPFDEEHLICASARTEFEMKKNVWLYLIIRIMYGHGNTKCKASSFLEKIHFRW